MNQLDAIATVAYSDENIVVKSVENNCTHDCNKQMQEVSIGNNCDSIIPYDGFEESSNLCSMPSTCLEPNDPEEDVQSPILCKSVSSRSPLTCSEKKQRAPSWTIHDVQEYYAMLELLQDTCYDSKDRDICLSMDTLGHMEQLLMLLMPQQSLL
ncbi:uncharacterized protein PHALS_00226 [Plasmopara halstedii]|uniref:Uncharacterized protein n=1 Tax=Plasmopara halstedii TaxID=4781 RepID=A0A0P1A6J0_PLAHL|nr:uncharacterized protein PHALS_00226 [Plasmopara halstedii]CEG35900.1 hypothetical protein PHALS_00226 [Plasmopara halstedii]|eukprot:XP_024572269.1 hypothetical protein PHALS_00226 [Plasmopara halstedii]